MNAVLEQIHAPVTKLDLGCGTRKKEGFHGVDSIAFEGVDTVLNLGVDAWPWADGTIEEAQASHFVEHLDATERIHFVNELFRVMKHGAKALIIVPHCFSGRAYGDLTHKWPPVAEFWFFYLSKEWRKVNAPHNDFEMSGFGYTCDFEVTWGNNLHPGLMSRNQEFQQHALTYFKEAAQDIVATFVRK